MHIKVLIISHLTSIKASAPPATTLKNYTVLTDLKTLNTLLILVILNNFPAFADFALLRTVNT